jgi:predicted nucleic acid-binding protein
VTRSAVPTRKKRSLGLTSYRKPARQSPAEDTPDDSPILRAALTASVDYLVTNDPHLLDLSPYEGLRNVSMSAYYRLLHAEGLLS